MIPATARAGLPRFAPEQPLEEIVSYFDTTLPKRDQYADDVHDAHVALGRLIPVRTSSSRTKKPATENGLVP